MCLYIERGGEEFGLRGGVGAVDGGDWDEKGVWFSVSILEQMGVGT